MHQKTGFQFTLSNWWRVYPRWARYADMATNYGFNDYEEILHMLAFGPFEIRWYTLK